MPDQVPVAFEPPIISKPENVDKFVKLFKGVHKVNDEQAAQMFEVEKYGFLRELQEKGIGQDCTTISVIGTFLDVVRDGLSFCGANKQVYILSRSVKNAAGQYEKRLYYSTSPDGKIFLAQRSGAIEYVTKPVIVYEGDEFQPYTNERGDQVVMHKPLVPRKAGAKVIAGYVFVIFKNGKREPYWMEEQDWKRLEGYSLKQNQRKDKNTGEMVGKANQLYSSQGGGVDPGFLGAKLISHALKNVRKSGTPSANYIEDPEPQEIAPQLEASDLVGIEDNKQPF